VEVLKMTDVRLTQLVSCAGCAGKIPPAFLSEAVSGIDWYSNENVLAAFAKCEDCGVYKIDEENALIHTTDFFSPVVDDPFIFGQIAAANALSDIYAMGGRPLSALNIVAYTVELGPEILHKILQGGESKAREAGCPIIGGHSVRAPEMKYGLAITGIVPIKNLKLNSMVQENDVLILTKPLGTGILNTAVKQDDLPLEQQQELIETMCRLNREAGDIAVKYQASAMTDVTGFGLLGHGLEMAQGSGVDFHISAGQLPVLPGVNAAIDKGYLTGGGKNNRLHVEGRVKLAASLSRQQKQLLFDPQTSGGLLIAVNPTRAGAICAELKQHYPYTVIIGEARPAENRDKVFLHVD
jgi:selenide,water dikinase